MRTFVGIAGLLVAAGLALSVGVAQPKTRAAATLRERLQRMREERSADALHLESLERRARARRHAVTLLRESAAASGSPASVRRRVLAVLSEAHLESVKLDVAGARPPAVAEVKVEAEGRFLNLVALSTRLAGPDVGLVLERVALRPVRRPGAGAEGGTTIAIEAQAVGDLR